MEQDTSLAREEPLDDREASVPSEDLGPSFTLVVAGVLGGAAALIAFIVVVVLWFDSYGNGHARGEQAFTQGVERDQAGEYCETIAADTTKPGSADGYWDLPWVWGCKRALG